MTSTTNKKGKKFVKYSLIGLGITFFLLIISLILIPILYKDKIKEIALAEANKSLKADVAVGDFDLTIFSTFPKLKFVFDDVSVTGRDDFEGIKLVDLKSFEAKLDFWSIMDIENMNIRSIRLIEPNIHVKILENGIANYDIVKSNEELAEEDIDTTAVPFKLSLKYYEIQNANLIYDDLDTISPMFVELKGLNHSGKGDLTAEIIDFKTKTTLEDLVLIMDKTTRLNIKNLSLDGDGKLNELKSDFVVNTTIEELKYVEANSLKAELYNFTTKGDIGYTPELTDVKTKIGAEQLSLVMDGLTYLSKVKTDLDLDLLAEFSDKSSKFTLKENSLKLNALALSFDGFYEMLEDHDNIDMKLKADKTSFKDLLSLVPAFYHTGYESMVAKGSLDLKGFVKGRLDDKNYPAWDVGTKVTNASIVYPDVKASINNVNIIAGSTFPGGSDLDKMTVDVDQLKATFAGNSIDGNFYLKNPMSDPYMKAKLNANIDLATLDQVYPMEEKYKGKLTSDLAVDGRMSALENQDYEKFNASGTLRLQEFDYSDESLPAPVSVSNMLFEFSPKNLKLVELKAKMGVSDFSMDGEVKNYMGYLFKENEDLKGNFNFYSSYINVDEIMPPSAPTTESPLENQSEEASDAFLVPKNIDFSLNTVIDKMLYDGMEIKNIKGNVGLKNQEASLNNLNLQALGGSVGLSGKYNTVDVTKPKADLKWSIKELDIQQLASNFITIDYLAPIAKYAQGKISSDFEMSTSLTSDFAPIYNTLSGFGSLMSSKIELTGFEPLNKLADAINIDKLKKQTIDNFNAHFEFNDGKVNVKPYTVKLGNIKTTVGGTTSFEKDIDYTINMSIPKADLPKGIIDIAEQAIAKAKNIPGFKMKELPAEIPITAFITNKINSPLVKTNLKEKLMELGGDIKGAVTDLVDEKVQEVKDTVKAVVDEKIEDVKEQVSAEVEKRKQQVLDAAQKQADNIKSEAKNLANKTKDEANKAAQKIVDEAGDSPLKKIAAEATAKKIREEGVNTAKKIEDEAKKRADDIMKRAREEADKIN